MFFLSFLHSLVQSVKLDYTCFIHDSVHKDIFGISFIIFVVFSELFLQELQRFTLRISLPFRYVLFLTLLLPISANDFDNKRLISLFFHNFCHLFFLLGCLLIYNIQSFAFRDGILSQKNLELGSLSLDFSASILQVEGSLVSYFFELETSFAGHISSSTEHRYRC